MTKWQTEAGSCQSLADKIKSNPEKKKKNKSLKNNRKMKLIEYKTKDSKILEAEEYLKSMYTRAFSYFCAGT